MIAFPGKLPREVGGTEDPLVAQFDRIEAASHADGSAGWNLAFTASSAGIAAARLPDDAVTELLDAHGEWPAFCGTFPMTGTATPVAGGYRLRGRWGFGSGIHEAEWVACGAKRDDTGAPIWFALPVGEVVVHDTWDAPGLHDTGSTDYSIEDVLVPERFAFDTGGPARRGGAPFRLPIQAYLTPDHTGVTLGCARRALEECAQQAVGKTRLGSAHALDARPAFVRDLGRAHVQLASVRTHVREVLARLDAAAELLVAQGGALAPALFLEARGAATHAAEVAVGVATFAYRNGGAHAALGSSTLGRAYRDAMTSSQHVHVLDDVYEWVGRAVLDGASGAGS